MSTTLNADQQAERASQTDAFALPKRDIADLMQVSNKAAPLDDQALLDGCAGSADFLTLILGAFQASAESHVDEIARQIESGDSDAVAVAAGKLKDSADGVAAGSLRALAATLEQFAGLMDRESQKRVVKRLREEMNRCLEHIPLLLATVQLGDWAT